MDKPFFPQINERPALSSSEAFRHWQEVVPADVRMRWIRRLASDHGITLGNKAQMNAFAREYFHSFDSNPQRMKLFFEQQNQDVARLAAGLKQLAATPREHLRNLYNEFPIPEFSLEAALDSERAHPPLVDVAAIAVVAPSALGPRTKAHSETASLNTVVLPTIHPVTQEFSANMIRYLGFLLERAQRDDHKDFDPRQIRGAFKEYVPALSTAFETIDGNGNMLHLSAPEHWDGSDTGMDWRALCGPHRLAHTFGPEGETSYRYCLATAIESARKAKMRVLL